MFDDIKGKIFSLFKRDSSEGNHIISAKQNLAIKIVIGVGVLLIFIAGSILSDKLDPKAETEEEINLKIELADKALDTERHWREHFEAQRAQDRRILEDALKEIKQSQEDIVLKTNARLEDELRTTQAQLNLAKQELASASLDLKRAAQDKNKQADSLFEESALGVQEFGGNIIFDKPKSAENYIPEGTFFTGHLLGGISVSTALNTPDENATPVTIQLKAKGNLHKNTKLNISKCRIMGSSYGDLSSERAIIRLEKMICEKNGIFTTTNIVGQVYGPDGYNGVKGKVIATSTKHLKNAMIGGIISGFSGSAKGSESMIVSSGGLVSTKKQGVKDMFAKGALQGAGNAGDKLADYYLRQAEAMSPVLMVPPGIKVEAQITKGFYMGEVGTHKRVKGEKR